jgi:hypothetical protein
MWGVIIVVLLVLGGYFWYTHSVANDTSYATTQQDMGSMPGMNEQTATTSTSDATIIQDSAAVDTQMSGLDSDNSNMNQSDQPIPQSY